MTTFEPWITEPGVHHGVPEAEYHAAPGLSSTGARALLDSPARYRWQLDHPQQRETTEAQDLGTVTHTLALGAGALPAVAPAEHVTDAGKLSTKKASLAWAEEQRTAGLIPISPANLAAAEAMAKALREHPTAGPLLARPGRAEVSLAARCPDTGVLCRGRVDWWPEPLHDGARQQLVDLKTARSADPAAFARSVADYGYDIQDVWYEDLVMWLGAHGGRQPRFVFVTVEKTAPYFVSVSTLDAETLADARRAALAARQLLVACEVSGVWPGYPDEPVQLDMPGWLPYQRAELADRYATHIAVHAPDLTALTDLADLIDLETTP